MKKVVAIIPAAGFGTRMGAKVPKQFLLLGDRPILAVTVGVFQECGSIDSIIIVVPENEIEYCRKEIVEKYRLNKVYKIIPGGKRRQDSVRVGLYAAKEILQDDDIVVIHDGVRPLIEKQIIEEAIEKAKKYRAVIVGIPAKDTIKEVNGEVIKTYNRDKVWIIQTPQVFRFKDIFEAHQMAYIEGWNGITDDSMLLEKMKIPIKVIKGSEINIKITTPLDLEIAKFLKSRKNI